MVVMALIVQAPFSSVTAHAASPVKLVQPLSGTGKITVKLKKNSLLRSAKKSIAIPKGARVRIVPSTRNGTLGQQDVTYKSDKKAVASVTKKGLIKAKKLGQAKITVVTLDETKKITLTVNVVKNYRVNGIRKSFVNLALDTVGEIPYYWGGKPDYPGWEGNGFGEEIEPDYLGRTRRGLDCSGYVAWVYWSVTGIKPGGMGTVNFTKSLELEEISYSELKPGDVGLIRTPGLPSNHIGIFVGLDAKNGKPVWVHCTGTPRNTVVCEKTDMFSVFYRTF